MISQMLANQSIAHLIKSFITGFQFFLRCFYESFQLSIALFIDDTKYGTYSYL